MSYPILEFDFRKHPLLADNVWHAQMAGHPKILTYSGPNVLLRRAVRDDAMHFDHDGAQFEIPRSLSRDEYPFACSVEGGSSSWVGHIPAAENSAQGGLIAAFLRRHGIVAGQGELSKFIVAVASHPSGPVTSPCSRRCLPSCKAGCRVAGARRRA
jgi:hypothetical protein